MIASAMKTVSFGILVALFLSGIGLPADARAQAGERIYKWDYHVGMPTAGTSTYGPFNFADTYGGGLWDRYERLCSTPWTGTRRCYNKRYEWDCTPVESGSSRLRYDQSQSWYEYYVESETGTFWENRLISIFWYGGYTPPFKSEGPILLN